MPWWVQLLFTLLGGGACGALLKVGYDNWSQRHQPVDYRISTDSVFSSAPHAGALQAQAKVTHEGHEYPFDALSLVRIEVKNKGNRDLDSFAFGITLLDGHSAVLCVVDGADRHHQINEVNSHATPATPKTVLDFNCSPFNRKDPYTIRLYVQNNGKLKPEQVKLSTAVPIRFARVQDIDENKSFLWNLLGLLTVIVSAALVALTVLTNTEKDVTTQLRELHTKIGVLEGQLDRIEKKDAPMEPPISDKSVKQ